MDPFNLVALTYYIAKGCKPLYFYGVGLFLTSMLWFFINITYKTNIPPYIEIKLKTYKKKSLTVRVSSGVFISCRGCPKNSKSSITS